jgi:predicted nucleotidyltransferase
MKHGLNENTVAQIRATLERFPQVEKAVLFGSRAKGNFKPGSDIDLALLGSDLHSRLLGQIEDALDDLLLPYRFSLLHYTETTDSEVARHIRRVGADFYEAAAGPSRGAASRQH